MERNRSDPFQISRKRKLDDEISDLPLPKHKCLDEGDTFRCDLSSDPHLDTDRLKNYIQKDGNKFDEYPAESGKGSNSCSDDADSFMSVSCEAKPEMQHLMISPYDWPSTSSVNWICDSSHNAVNASDSKSETESLDVLGGLRYIEEEHISPYTAPGFEEQSEDTACYDSSKYGIDNIEECEDKEIDNLIHLSGVIPNNVVLSSGRWKISEVPHQKSEKLTIDKEFEQYFSMLML